MKAEELSKKLNIDRDGHEEEVGYVVTLNDSDDYARVYTLLDNSSYCELNTDVMLLSDEASLLNYETVNYSIDLVANFNEDTYKVVFKEKK